MKFLRLLILAVILTFPGTAAWAEPSEIGRRAAEQFIVPGYAALLESAIAQRDAMTALCDQPGERQLTAARQKFAELVTAWSRIEIIRFGPILADNRIDRILFWPDRRGIALRQIQALLAEKDPEALQPDRLRQKSVALQGLGSLEYVLFGAGAGELSAPNGYRCALGKAIAGAILTTADEVLTAWQAPGGIVGHLAAPAAENADYRSNDEVLSEILGVFVHGFELIRDVRLGPITAIADNQPNARIAIYRRSELTVESVKANIAGLQELFELSGIEDTFTADLDWVADAMQFEFENFQSTANLIEATPIEAAVAGGETQSKLGYLRILTQSLQDMAVRQIAVSLGLSAGFSSLDGD